MEQIRVIQYGCGKMGRIMLRYLHEKGCRIVGAIDADPALVGRDVGEVADLGMRLGVQVAADAEAVFAGCDAHVALIATRSLIGELEDAYTLAARHGVCALSTCEEAFYPWTTAAPLTNRLDRLAKQHGVTLSASGYQDVFWGKLVSALAGATHRIERIEGLSSYNVEDYGIALAEAHGAGLSADEFKRQITDAEALPSYMWNSAEWLAAELDFSVRSVRQVLEPILAPHDVKSATLGGTIPAGHALGMRAVVTLATYQGVVIEAQCVGKVYLPGEVDRNDWTVRGEPTTTLQIAAPDTVALTCATLVNRIPQLLAAPPGFVTCDHLAAPRYQPYPLGLPD